MSTLFHYDFIIIFRDDAMYEKYCELRDKAHLTDYKVSKMAGIGQSTFTDWKNGRSVPKTEKLAKIATVLGVTVDYFTVQAEQQDEEYYIDKDARDLAEFLHKNPKYKILFDASRKVKPEDIDFVKQMIDRLGGTNEE